MRFHLLLALPLLALGLSGCGEPEQTDLYGTNAPSVAGANTPAANAPAANAPAANAPADAGTPAAGGNPQVIIETAKGTIQAELFRDKAPITVENFLKYVNKKHYDGTIFHRVIPDFMVQGGGFTPDMNEKPTDAPIKNEAGNGLKNERGTLAMARTGDPDSATSQFFINLKHNEFLDRANAQDGVGYAVFGRVTEGMDVVDAIVAVPTTTKEGHENVPQEAVVIKSIRVK